MEASEQIKEQIRLMKLENERKRKLREQTVEDLSGRETFRVVQERKYAPLIEATSKAALDTTEGITSINNNISSQNLQLQLQQQALEAQKSSSDTLFRSLAGLQEQAAIENAQGLLNETLVSDIESIPPKILHFLGARDKDSLSIRYEEQQEPKGFYLGLHPLQAIGEYTINVNNRTYVTTDGTWMLLTKSPANIDQNEISETDFNHYARIMWETGHAYTYDVNGKKVLKTSKSWKWQKLKNYGQAKGWFKSSERSKSTGSPSGATGQGLVRFIPSDMEYIVGKLYTTLGNLELNHTNIEKEDIYLTMELLDSLRKSSQLSDPAYKNIYALLNLRLKNLS